MAAHKLFDEPKFHDATFYEGREVSDHIHESAHRGRILKALADVNYLLDFDDKSETVGDFGCGNGGMLWMLKQKSPDTVSWGYDLSPKAIEYAKEKYGVNAFLKDFPNDADVQYPDIAVMTEVLEHLVDPPAMLKKLKKGGVRWIVATSPMWEDAHNHYEYHLWAWDAQGFKQLFKDAGYFIFAHYGLTGGACHHLIALNRDALSSPLPLAP